MFFFKWGKRKSVLLRTSGVFFECSWENCVTLWVHKSKHNPHCWVFWTLMLLIDCIRRTGQMPRDNTHRFSEECFWSIFVSCTAGQRGANQPPNILISNVTAKTISKKSAARAEKRRPVGPALAQPAAHRSRSVIVAAGPRGALLVLLSDVVGL